jgi:hypothetical protein
LRSDRSGRLPARSLTRLSGRLRKALVRWQQRLYADAQTCLAEIISELKPGTAFDEPWSVFEPSPSLRSTTLSGIRSSRTAAGLADEYPTILFDRHHEGEIEEGMVFSMEAYVGVEGEDEGLKLEEQVLVTPTGVELLSHAPHDEHLAAD